MAESVPSVLCEKLLETDSVPADTLELDSLSEWLGHGDSELSFSEPNFTPMVVFGGRGCAGCTIGFFITLRLVRPHFECALAIYL